MKYVNRTKQALRKSLEVIPLLDYCFEEMCIVVQ